MAMVEAVTGQHWRDYFVARVRDPAGMGDAQFLNPLNPSGSMWASITEYASFVRTLFHDGRDGAAVVLSAEAVALQQANHMPPDVVRVSTPEPDLEYGLNNWRWCYQPVDARVLGDANQIVPDLSCASEHLTGHSGKGGFGPWIDVQRGIYGVFAMREETSGNPEDYTPEELNRLKLVRLYSGLAFDNLPAD